MTNTLQQPELQQRTLRLYGELLCRRSDWAGQLVFAAFAGAGACGFAAAASLAGAASLTVDADAALMKAHFRDGAYDFVVNTLDEALRALKNEIRRGRPIAIGLMARPADVLAEAAERGIAASLVLSASAEPEEAERLIVQNKGFLVQVEDLGLVSAELQSWLDEKGWRPALVFPQDLPTDDPERQRWALGLSTHQRSVRKNDRWVWIAT